MCERRSVQLPRNGAGQWIRRTPGRVRGERLNFRVFSVLDIPIILSILGDQPHG